MIDQTTQRAGAIHHINYNSSSVEEVLAMIRALREERSSEIRNKVINDFKEKESNKATSEEVGSES